MVGTLVRLSLALQRGGRRRGGALASFGWIAQWTLAVIGGLGIGALVAFLASVDAEGAQLVLPLVFTGVLAVWVFAPILVPGLGGGGVVDPRRLEQFPLRPRDQVVGLLLGTSLGPGAGFTVLVALGLVAAPGLELGARVVALPMAVAYTLMCVASSSGLQAALAGALSSRRGRDLTVLFSGVVVVALYLFSQAAANLAGAVAGASSTAGTVLGWIPPGAAPQTVLLVDQGGPAAAAAHAGVVVATIGLALWLWAWGIRRNVRGGVASGTRERRVSIDDARLELIPPVVRQFGAGPMTAAGSQQLRYFFFRSPRAVQALLITPVIGVVVAHQFSTQIGPEFAAAAFAVLATIAAVTNVLGFDGRGVEYLVLGGAPLRRVLLAKVFAPLPLVLLAVVAFVLVEAGLQSTWDRAAASLVAGIATVAVTAGIGSVSSALNPYDQAKPPKSRLSVAFGAIGGVTAAYGAVALGAVGWAFATRAIPIPVVASTVLVLALAAATGLMALAARSLDFGWTRLLSRFADA